MVLCGRAPLHVFLVSDLGLEGSSVLACWFWGGCVGGANLHNTQPSAQEGSLGMVLCGRPPLHVVFGF